jgi:hypothetical protein
MRTHKTDKKRGATPLFLGTFLKEKIEKKNSLSIINHGCYYSPSLRSDRFHERSPL